MMQTYKSHEIVKAVKCSQLREYSGLNPEIKGRALIADDQQVYSVPDYFFSHGTPSCGFYIIEKQNGYCFFMDAIEFEKHHILENENHPENEHPEQKQQRLFVQYHFELRVLQIRVEHFIEEGLQKGFLCDPRLTAIAKTDIEKGFIVANSILTQPEIKTNGRFLTKGENENG